MPLSEEDVVWVGASVDLKLDIPFNIDDAFPDVQVALMHPHTIRDAGFSLSTAVWYLVH